MGAGKGGVCGSALPMMRVAARAVSSQYAVAANPARPFGGVFLDVAALYCSHIHPDVETQSAIESRNEETI